MEEDSQNLKGFVILCFYKEVVDCLFCGTKYSEIVN